MKIILKSQDDNPYFVIQWSSDIAFMGEWVEIWAWCEDHCQSEYLFSAYLDQNTGRVEGYKLEFDDPEEAMMFRLTHG